MSSNIEKVCDETFEALIKPYTEIDKLKGNGLAYTEETMVQAKSRYKTIVEDTLALKGYNKEDEIVENKKEDKKIVKELKPIKRNKGFADILILTIIVLVYAAIIINLIIKLK